MKLYKTTLELVTAVQYHYPATQELKDWLGRCYYMESAERRINGLRKLSITNLREDGSFEQTQNVHDGFWIVKCNDKFHPLTNEAFLEKYEEIRENFDPTKNAIKKAIDALEQIGDPVGHATKNLQQGYKLNGRYLADLVVQLMPVRDVALDALEELKKLPL